MDEVRLSEHVVALRGPNAGTYPHGVPLRVTGGDTTVQIDSSLESGCGDADLILLSHYHEDHVVGIGAVNTPVMVHRRDVPAVASWEGFARYMNVPAGAIGDDLRETFHWSPRTDLTAFSDDAVIDVGGGVRIRVVPLPGHTGGHCGFYVEPDGVFFTADVDLSSFGPVYADLESTLPDVRASLARCAEIEADVYATYHHKGPYTDRAEFLADLAAHGEVLDARTQRLRALLDEGSATAKELLGRGVVYRVGGRRPWYADVVEEITIEHHLAEV